MKSKFLAKIFPLQITRRFFFWTVILTLIPVLMLLAVIPMITIKMVRTEREKQLYAVVDRLIFRMPGSYNDILTRNRGGDFTREEQVHLLNRELQPIVNALAPSFPNISMGYYSMDLDSVLAISPEIKPFTVMNVSHDQQYFDIYQRKKPKFGQYHTSIAWGGKSIIWYAYPLITNGKITGHVWADVKNETIFGQAMKLSTIILSVWLVIVIALFFLSNQIFKRVKKDLAGFSNSVINQNLFTSEILPELNPMLENIKGHLEKQLELARLVESSNDAIIYVDKNELICYWNKSAERIYGYLSKEIIGQPYWTLVPLKCREESIENVRQVVNGELVQHVETVRLGKNGVLVNVSLSVSPIFDFAGEIKGISITARDITMSKQVEKEMARLERLNIVGQMAAGIGHEVRNPMTTVKGFLQLLANKETESQKKEYYELMIEELNRANSIITEFLSLAGERYVEFKPASPNVIINALYPLLNADAMEQDKCLILNKGDIPKIPLNEKEIRQLIINLVRNALEASPPSGVITLRTYLSGGEVVLSVEDMGSGIPSEVLDKLGTPFITTKENGTGLGLPVCYSVAHKHNARIDVKTGPAGTTFYVRFKTRQQKTEGWVS